eukprot:CAMPEP_0184644778 /NCGR_PEP_ID=MMETSP0308-20130426/1424_1 /TAXON_ID=38269 /ORGANISM="Gloeochaete witrockiana, Strain SAG 46.84" /LENGTH=495 /DNA_ID=CAMNT_0027073481 /DNA_START=208 /DNA_END=1695 /DNA_ORIENTATION=+
MAKLGRQDRVRDIWIGVGIGIGCSAIIGVVFGALRYGSGQVIFEGDTEALFEGITMAVAATLVTYMIIWSMYNAKNLSRDIAADVAKSLSKDSRWSLMALAFIQVFKEGVELVLLVMGAISDEPKSIPLAAVIGILISIGLAYLFFRGSLYLDLQAFFFWSNVVLTMFAAGLVARAFHEFQEIQKFGSFEIEDVATPWWNTVLWNTGWCCDKHDNGFFQVLQALFGYEDTPNPVEFFAYFGYWTLIIGIHLYINYADLIRRDAVGKAGRRTIALSMYFGICSIIGIVVAANTTAGTYSWNGILCCVLWLATSVYGVFVGMVRKRIHTLLFFVMALTSLLVSLGFNIADMARGTFPEGGSVERFFYWLTVFDWNGFARNADAFVNESWNVPMALLCIVFFMNILICGGFTWSAWSFHEALRRVETALRDPVTAMESQEDQKTEGGLKQVVISTRSETYESKPMDYNSSAVGVVAIGDGRDDDVSDDDNGMRVAQTA